MLFKIHFFYFSYFLSILCSSTNPDTEQTRQEILNEPKTDEAEKVDIEKTETRKFIEIRFIITRIILGYTYPGYDNLFNYLAKSITDLKRKIDEFMRKNFFIYSDMPKSRSNKNLNFINKMIYSSLKTLQSTMPKYLEEIKKLNKNKCDNFCQKRKTEFIQPSLEIAMILEYEINEIYSIQIYNDHLAVVDLKEFCDLEKFTKKVLDMLKHQINILKYNLIEEKPAVKNKTPLNRNFLRKCLCLKKSEITRKRKIS